MALPLKFLTFFTASEGYGWSEVHYKQSTSDNPNLNSQLDTFNVNVVPLRAAILGQGCAIVGTRVSYPRNGVNASFGVRSFFPGNALAASSAPALSLAVSMTDTTFTRHKIIHVRGFWDSVEQNGTYQPGASDPPGFNVLIAQWKDALIVGGYGWLSKDAASSANGIVTNYVVGADQRVTFTLAGAGMPAYTVGTIQSVRFARFNNSKSVLNRPILVFVFSANIVVTVQPHAAGPIQGQGTYNFRGVGFVGYNFLGGVALGERRMGKPLNRSPGRSKVKPTV